MALRRAIRAPRRVLSGPEQDEARALSAAQKALGELRAVLGRQPADAARVLRVLEQLEVHAGERPQPDRVQVATPEAIRARRFEVVFACGLQEGEFPRGATPEPFLSDEDRRAIATASGLVLPVREDRLDRERYLFYVCASRAERLLVVSSRSSDEEGNPQAESYFVDDVRELLGEGAEERTRSLSDVTWTADDAPTAAELDRAHAAAGPRRPEPAPGPLTTQPLLDHLASREAVSAGALEHFADCPVKWLVENLLRPDELAPDPEAMVRGSYAHDVLQHTYRRLREETGERRVTHANLADAERILLEELRERRSEFRLSPKQTRVRAAARRLEFDLLRFLRSEADSDSRFEPAELELAFGLDEGSEPVEVAGGLRLRGRIDRVDVKDGMALVIDYKTGRSVDRYKVASWEPENRFQAALYMLVVERLLGLRPVGGVYVALAATTFGRAAWSRPRWTNWGAATTPTTGSTPRSSGRSSTGRSSESARRTRACAAARSAPSRTAATGTAAASTRRSAGATDEGADPGAAPRGRAPGRLPARAGRRGHRQDNRAGGALRAGRVEDEVGVESILAITFTEKAAAEMRTRVRRRFLDLGRREEARASESAWISTIHGFCSRVLRGHALSAGIDPDFRVLDELESERLAADAFDGALEEFMGDGSEPDRIEMVAAYRPDPLRDMVRTAYSHLRSRGERHPRLDETLPPRPAGEHERLEDAARTALAELALAAPPPRWPRRSTASRLAHPSRAATQGARH